MRTKIEQNRAVGKESFERERRRRSPPLRAHGAPIRRDGDRLIVEMPGLTHSLKSIEPWDDAFPDVDAGLPALDQPDVSEEGEERGASSTE